MPNINLIAEQIQAKREQQKKSRAWMLAFAGASCVTLLAFGFLTLRMEMLSAQHRNLQAKQQQLKPFEDEIAANEGLLNVMKPKLVTLSKARIDTQRWLRILDHVALVMPPNTWVTQLKSQNPSDPTKPVEVSWTGMSAEQNLVGELMLRLQRSEFLGAVELKYTDERRNANGVGLEFQINALVPGTEEQVPSATDDKAKGAATS